MKLKLIYGRSGTGKSTYLYEDIKAKLNNTTKNNHKIFIVVPEQCNLSAERKLFEITGKKSLINVEVLTLSRMAYRILSEVGGLKKQVSKIGKYMLIYSILSKEKSKLNFLGKSEKNVDIVDRMFTEFKKHQIDVSFLQNLDVKDKYTELKLQDILKLYEKYEEKLKDEFIDENDILDLLVEKIDKTDMLRDSDIYIDEFLGFTKQEYKVFEKLSKLSNEITVAISTDNLEKDTNKENDIFYFNKKYANKLIEIFSKYSDNIELICLDKNLRSKNEELKFLEKNFSNLKIKYDKETKNIHMFLANNPYSEVEYIAKEIHKKVKKCGYRYKDIGIISENMEQYSEDIKAVFQKYEIPVFIDEKKELNQNILIKFIIAMLDIFSKNWSYEAVFNYLKIGLLPVELEKIYKLENYCLKWGIKGSKWNKEFIYEPVNDNQEELEKLRKVIVEPLNKFKEDVSKERNAKEITKGLYNFLINNQINVILNEKIEKYNNYEISDEYNTSFQLLIQVFDEICLLFSDEKMGFEKYKNILQIGINACELGKIPATQDQVVFGDTERTRSHKLKVVFIVGANDGTFPKVNKVEGYLNDSDRAYLKAEGVELAKDSIDSLYEEQFNIYRTLTTPENEIYITYASSDKEGKAIRPSMLIKKIKRCFKNITEESDIISKKYEITNKVASFEETLEVYKDFLNGKDLDKEWEDSLRYFYQKNNANFKRAISGMKFSSKAQVLTKHNIQSLYGGTLFTSVSRLENYRKCPFSFHLTYGLKLKEKEELRLNFTDTGSFMHEVIDEFFKELDERKILIKEVTNSQIKMITDEIIDQLLKTSRYYTFSSTAKFKVLTRRLKKVVLEAIEYIVYTLKNSDFKILGHELEFGNKKNYETIKIDLDGKKVEITGKIDRVDIAEISDKQYVRIIDYKSSMKDLDLNQVMSGLQIQLITYLDAICEQEEVNPSGVLYLGLIDNVVKSDKNLTEEEIEEKIRKNFKMKGLILSDISVVKSMDNKLNTGASDIVPVYITKDGEISNSKSSTVSKEDFESLTKKVKEVIKDIAKEILQGKIDIKPYYYKNKTGCDYCKYKTICMFNNNGKDNEYWYLKNKEKALILEEIRENK